STCQGTSVTLSATGGSSYLWSTGATTQTINVNPNATTTYSVQVTQNGCTSSDDVTVTVNPVPTINAGADVTINSGDSVTLTATGGASYSWNTGATTSSITVSPTVTTTYTVTGTLNGCQSTDTVTVFVNNLQANAGPDVSICHGYSTTLTASGGDTYLWSTGATTSSITVNPTSTSTYSVTVFVGNLQDTDDVTVYVNPNPNVIITNGSEVTILQGEYVTLSATGANTYLWNNGATQPNIAVSPNATTTYSVTGYINNCSDQKQVVVNVLQSVTANAGNDVTVCLQDNTVTLTASGGDEYLWNTGETTASITVNPEVDTEYSVTVYNALDYDIDEVMVYVNDCADPELPEESSEDLEFLVYPNPTYGNLNIRISGLLSVSSIYLYDISGKTLYHEVISENGEQQSFTKTMNISNFAAGIYLLKLVDNRTVVTKKIILR
ncbi:MAG: T9SS type A sorting domain-containing protein, partial [Gelidibacter sp.]|nr:T9SS type A sorting domain-containing protein [Gelidibacter sp.]